MIDCSCHERTDEEKYHDLLDYYYEHFKRIIEADMQKFGIEVYYADGLPIYGYKPSKYDKDKLFLALPELKSDMSSYEKLKALNTMLHEYGHSLQYGSPYNIPQRKEDINSLETAKQYLAQETFAETYAAYVLNTIGLPAVGDKYLEGHYDFKWEIRDGNGNLLYTVPPKAFSWKDFQNEINQAKKLGTIDIGSVIGSGGIFPGNSPYNPYGPSIIPPGYNPSGPWPEPGPEPDPDPDPNPNPNLECGCPVGCECGCHPGDDAVPPRPTEEYGDTMGGANGVPRCPLILDLDGDGITTTTLEDGVYFDHDGNLFAGKSAWVGKGDGLLVFDQDMSGQIESGSELFGDHTTLANGQKAPNGFEALKQYDSNNDGIILYFTQTETVKSII